MNKLLVLRAAIFTFCLTLFHLRSEGHDLLVAMFNIYEAENGFDLEIRIDKENILESIKRECPTFANNDVKIKNYIYDHFTIKMDGQEVDYDLTSYAVDEYFVVLKGKLLVNSPDFENMEVWNTCMIQTIKEHSNIIWIKRNDKKRSFRLNRDRHQTVISY